MNWKLPVPKKNLLRGFTLIELVVVVSVIAILTSMALIGFNTVQAQARDTQRKQIMTSIQAALERFYSDHGWYPSSDTFGGAVATDLASYITNPSDPKKGCDVLPAAGSNWSPCSSSPTKPFYTYEKQNCSSGVYCQGYILRLTPESGGAQVSFNSPN